MTALMLPPDRDLARWVLDALRSAEVTALDRHHELPRSAGAYVVGLGAPDPLGLYAEAVAKGAGLYAGSTGSLAARLAGHHGKLDVVGLTACRPLVVVLPTPGKYGRGHARLAEEVLLATLPLAWNRPGPLWGFGANPQGVRRLAPPAPWWRVHGTDQPDAELVESYRQWWTEHRQRAVGVLARRSHPQARAS